MRRSLFGLSLGLFIAGMMALFVNATRAGVTCTLPFNLQNNTTADATQVMANYNALVACLGNAAAAGVNADITALTALTTPLTPAQGGSNYFIGGTSGGSANAQTIASTVPLNFTLTTGNKIGFIAGNTNSDATTVNVQGTGAIAVNRQTQLGTRALVGGEFLAGQWVELTYDGAAFQLVSAPPTIIGQLIDWAGYGPNPVNGTLYADGSCQLRAGKFAALFSVIGTQYDPTGSTCDVNHFAIPDYRGRVTAYQDNMGSNGTAGRITMAGSNCIGTIPGGAGCGGQTSVFTLSTANIPTGLFTFNDASHTHVCCTVAASNNFFHWTALYNGTGGGGNANTPSGGSSQLPSTDASVTGASITDHAGGGSTTISVLNPTQIATKLIRY